MTLFWIILAIFTLGCVAYLLHAIWTQYSVVKLAGLFLALPFSASFLYYSWGASPEVAQAHAYQLKSALVAKEVKQLGSRSQVIKLMQIRVTQQPDQPRGWYLLGKLHMGGGDFQKAVECFDKANQLEADNVEIMMALCEAQLLKNHNQLPKASRAMLDKLIQQHPKLSAAINILGIDAFNHKQYPQAVAYWEKILPEYRADSEDGKALLRMIAKAQKLQTS